MQTANLPIQVNSTAPAPKAARAKNAAADDGSRFSQALSREIDQQKSPMIPAPAQGQPKPAAQAKAPQPPKQADKAPAPNSAPAEPSRKAGAKTTTANGADDDAGAQASAAAAAAATTPVVDLLALVASFNQPPAAVAPTPAAIEPSASDPLLASPGKRAAIELPVDGVVQLAQAAKNLLAGQPLTRTLPAAAGEATPALASALDKRFTNMMAKADGSMLDGPKPTAPETVKDSGVGFERAVPQAGLERAAGSPPAAESAAPNMLKALPDPAQNAGPRARALASDVAPVKEIQGPALVAAPLQQAALSVAQVVNGVPAGERIAARVGTPAWDNQVAQKIVWMVGGAEQSASLTLNPPELGPLQVVLSVTNDMASVTFSSAQPEVRQALEDAMPKLRDMMSENGIALGNASVNDGAAGQQQNDGQPARRGGGAQRAELGAGGSVNGSASEAAAKNAARPGRAGEAPGLVDTFA